jgi:hypothetical protein
MECEHPEVGYRLSALTNTSSRTEVHDFPCAGCEVCARIVQHVPLIPEEDEE